MDRTPWGELEASDEESSEEEEEEEESDEEKPDETGFFTPADRCCSSQGLRLSPSLIGLCVFET